MRILLVTEKCNPEQAQRDGGSRLVTTLQRAWGSSLSVMQFGPTVHSTSTWHFDYPIQIPNRFERRLANAPFIAQKVQAVQDAFTHVIFVHIAMQFGLILHRLREDLEVWTFPMFLTPSYIASGEVVPESYLSQERQILAQSKNIITPSPLEKQQLIDFYSIPAERIHTIPRGIDTTGLNETPRFLKGPLRFCSIGSIKHQKNTLGLLSLFAKIQTKLPGATLRVIGPVQDVEYHTQVQTKIYRLGLKEAVELVGHIPHPHLAAATQDSHLHLSQSTCETFGRAIFETLAWGLPNLARSSGNAAAAFLKHVPYARFIDDEDRALEALEEMLSNYSQLSSMAREIGVLYDDAFLSRLLVAKICRHRCIAISDFDGTLFHKDDPAKTFRCIKAFKRFPVRVVCSARHLDDLRKKLASYDLSVDWIVSCSGGVVSNGEGQLLWTTPLEPIDMFKLKDLTPQAERIMQGDEVIQISTPTRLLPPRLGLRIESYQNTAFISAWGASKLRAVHRLLRYINWEGQIRVFGDGKYDHELLTYFDGTLITPLPQNGLQKKEVAYV